MIQRRTRTATRPRRRIELSAEQPSQISPIQAACIIFGMVFIAGFATILLSIQGIIDAKTRARREERKENVSVHPDISSNWCDFRSEENASDGTQRFDIYRENLNWVEEETFDVLYNMSVTFDATRHNISDFVSLVGMFDSFTFVVGYAIDIQKMFFLDLGFIPRQG